MNYLPSLLFLLTAFIIFNCGNREDRVTVAGYFYMGGVALFILAII